MSLKQINPEHHQSRAEALSLIHVCHSRRAATVEPGSEADALCCLQNFLSVNGIKFYESKMNLNWKPIIKSIQEVGRSAILSL